MEDLNAWRDSIVEDLHLQEMKSQTFTVTIPKVPDRIRRGEIDAYEPQVISFGPYHHGKKRLQYMEKYKRPYQKAFLSRNKNFRSEIYINKIINEITKHETEIKMYDSDYFNTIHLGIDFWKMMLLDTCFILEYFRRFKEGLKDELDKMVWAHDLIQNDILLLENQLPFSVVNSIFNLVMNRSSSMDTDQPSPSQTSSFTDDAISYFNSFSNEKPNFKPPEPVHHLLHLYHSYCLYSWDDEESPSSTISISGEDDKIIPSATIPQEESGEDDKKGNYIIIPSATILQEEGVTFTLKKVEGRSFLDVEFDFDKGKIMIPPLVISISTLSKFRNLIAFEQLYPYNEEAAFKSFNAYLSFLDCIIDKPEDVTLLSQNGIISHYLGSHTEIAEYFNNATIGTFSAGEHYLLNLYHEVDKYRKKRRNRNRATLMRNHCNTPWAVLGIAAGTILLLLTILQTIFSGLSTF